MAETLSSSGLTHRRATPTDSPNAPASSSSEVNVNSLAELKQWIQVQTRILRRWKNRYVVVGQGRIRAYDAQQDTVPQLDIPLSEVTDVAISSDHTLVIVKVRDGTQFVFKFAVPERAKDWAKYVATRSQKKKK